MEPMVKKGWPRARRKDGRWRKKRSDYGIKRNGKTNTSYQQKSTAAGDENHENTVALEKQSGHL